MNQEKDGRGEEAGMEAAERQTGEELPERWSARAKTEIVLRLLKGEELGTIGLAPPQKPSRYAWNCRRSASTTAFQWKMSGYFFEAATGSVNISCSSEEVPGHLP